MPPRPLLSPTPRGARLAIVAGVIATAAAACDRDVPPKPVDTAAAPAPVVVPPPPPPAATSTWDADAGEALVVPGDAGEALVVVPGSSAGTPVDTAPGAAAGVLPGTVALFSRAGDAASARAEPLPRPAGPCPRWPTARLSAADEGLVQPWTVGFVGRGAVVAMPLDSIEGLSSGDSAQFAATVTRLAAALPGDTAHDFRGLPFTVRSAQRFTIGDTQGVVATLARTVNQEAEPLAEQVLLVAERAASPNAPWRVAYHERRSGAEEALPLVEPLAAVRLGADARPTLVLARDFEKGSAYSLLERAGGGVWKVRWTSAYVGCPRR